MGMMEISCYCTQIHSRHHQYVQTEMVASHTDVQAHQYLTKPFVYMNEIKLLNVFE